MNLDMPMTLQEAVVDGLTRLMALRLRGSPAAENVQQTAAVWIAAMASRPITWDVDLDLVRIQKGFIELAATANQWPAPADFIRAMPGREHQRKLEAPKSGPMSEATRKLVDDFYAKWRRKSA